jgi:hypothetical protein
LFITVLAGIVPLYPHKILFTYTNPSGWLFNHAVLANALPPIEVTLDGMVMLVRLVQPLNALFSIEVTPAGMVMLVSLLQPENALLPIEVTLEGMVMLVRLVQP